MLAPTSMPLTLHPAVVYDVCGREAEESQAILEGTKSTLEQCVCMRVCVCVCVEWWWHSGHMHQGYPFARNEGSFLNITGMLSHALRALSHVCSGQGI